MAFHDPAGEGQADPGIGLKVRGMLPPAQLAGSQVKRPVAVLRVRGNGGMPAIEVVIEAASNWE
jgi:hypothetical protein